MLQYFLLLFVSFFLDFREKLLHTMLHMQKKMLRWFYFATLTKYYIFLKYVLLHGMLHTHRKMLHAKRFYYIDQTRGIRLVRLIGRLRRQLTICLPTAG